MKKKKAEHFVSDGSNAGAGNMCWSWYQDGQMPGGGGVGVACTAWHQRGRDGSCPALMLTDAS